VYEIVLEAQKQILGESNVIACEQRDLSVCTALLLFVTFTQAVLSCSRDEARRLVARHASLDVAHSVDC
jgi:hypothetical protein